ncbi:ATP-binding protein [Aquabacterium sp.]|uniref:ATP-binding protein n=1 Tax=Aquabacterium sp. TaxID=1872578 RepID=UPI002CB21E02|nr:BTAD domain-containing putative transcriptional regulator [Aquabacterium sp.]HSW04086.1 BTAD domain-containing putative transcriptional regulator [Aquabacterium sp.]
MADLRFQLFGVPAVEHGGRTLVLPFERRSQLAVLLALRRQWVPRTEVAALLWPELSDKQAFANLRKTLFRLPLLPWAQAVVTETVALRFDVPTDVAAFETALHEGRAAEALAAYGGELLDGFDDGQSEGWTRWLGFERDRLRAAWRHAALACLEGGALDAAAALALAARLLESDPLDEAALQHRMNALAASGQAGAARAAYRQFVERLQADLGLEPGAALRALHDSLVSSAAPHASASTAPAAAPAADDGFVGRSGELARITDLMSRDECRLLCLVGPGGVGKSRLARRAMQLLAPQHADGAAFVVLEDVETAAQFGLRLAQEAGVATGQRSGGALDRAIDAWRDRQLLLVLDNFEQLADQATTLALLLQQCPRVKAIVTSRVRLQLADEWLLPIEGLPCPDPEDGDRVEAFDAVRLFVNAARRVEPAFSPGPDAASIVDICRQVDGLPLALELAAAWVRVLSCADIARELHQGTELLRAADARLPQRHASLETVFEHSWRRLGPIEREALARLSVFHGGFSVETARAVAGASLPVLGALADKSLLAKDRQPTTQRMRLHPLVQQLAALRLQALDAHAATQDRHAAHFHGWLQQLEPGAARGRREALRAIDDDFENGRRAWMHSIVRHDAAALLRVLPAWHHYFEHRARFEDGLALWRAAADSPLAAAHDVLRARVLGQCALMEMRLARYADAQATAADALTAAQPSADRDACYQALAVQAGCAHYAGRSAQARETYLRALDLARARAHASDIASTLDNLALCEKRLGHYDEALGLALEALAEHRHHGDDARLAVCLNNLGSLYTFLDQDDAARQHLLEAQALCERHGLVSTRAFALANLSDLALKAGDVGAARAFAEQGLAGAEAAGLRSLAAWLQVHLARIVTRQGALGEARTLLADAAEVTLTLGMQSVKPSVMMAFAELLDAQGHARTARRVLGFAAAEPSLSAPDRDELLAAWTRRRPPQTADPPWPGWPLSELMQRIVAEAPLAHAPLIADLA